MKRLASLMLILVAAGTAAQPAPAVAPPAPSLRGMAWTAVNGRASDLSIGADGAVFAIDPEGLVWLRRPGKNSSWIRLPGDFRRIAAASERNAWAIDAEGMPYAYNGTWWRPMGEIFPVKAVDIAISSRGGVYAVAGDGSLQTLDARRGALAFPDAPGNLKRVSVDDAGHPWAVDRDGAVHRFDGKAWSRFDDVRAADVSAGHGGIWIVGTDGQLLTFDNGAVRPRQVAAGAGVVATAPGGVPWVATSDGHIYAHRPDTGAQAQASRQARSQVFTELLNWQRVNGSARQLAISPSGAILALGRDGEAWQWKGSGQWGRLPGIFSRLALDKGNVPWGIADGRILRYQGSYWSEIPGRAAEIVGGADGSIWIVQPDGQPARWKARERQWQAFFSADKLLRLAVGPDGEPWAVAESGRVVRRTDTGWEALPEVDAASIAIGPDGSVFVTGTDNRLLRWDGAGKRWELLNGNAEAVAVGPRGKPWIVAPEGRILASALFDDIPDNRVNTTSIAAGNAAASAARNGSAAAATVVGQPGIGSGAQRGRINEPLEYRKVAGKARNVAIGADGSVFIVAYDGSLARWSNTRSAFVAFPGQLARIAVAPDGKPWGIAGSGDVYRHDGAAWKQVRNVKAQDIGIGFNGTVLVADPQGFLSRYDPAGDAFVRLPADANGVPPMGTRVAVTPAGKPWVITDDGFVGRCEKASCERLPVKARSLAIGPEGSVLIVDGDRTLRRWNQRDESFERIDGIPDLIDLAAVGPRGKPWLLSPAAEIWASEFFPRDERGDVTTAAVTEARFNAGATTGTSSPPAFSFTVNAPFEKLSNLGPPFVLPTEAKTLQLAIAPATGRATLIDADNRFFNYNDATRTLVLDTTIPALPVSDEVRSFVIGKDGSYWVTSGLDWNAGVWRLQANKWVEVSGNWPPPGGLAWIPITVSEAPDGTMYASGLDRQLYRYDQGVKRFVRITMPLPNGMISSVAVTPDGHFWVGSEGISAPGLYERVGNGWQLRLAASANMSDSFLEQCKMGVYTCFATGANGNVYTVDIFSYRLQRWNAASRTWDKLGASPNMIDRGVFAVGPDGRPWAIQRSGGGAGLYRVR
ncbi:MAG: hypothetical protein BGO63_01190 [Candidatus Accumulibacter sp. 66-26]|nr:hypothetical protein [Accumulibacter sp.]OJW46344.1 MAG: hypothetical protein BGO63_01190 [Candidatus Accumulibacter sp. 66-26]